MEASTLYLAENGHFPNSPLPVLLYLNVYGGQRPDFPGLFARSGWGGIWVNGVYSFHHFHASAFEALGCQAGWARLILGGPGGQEVTVNRGDAVLLPPGTGHFLKESSPDFLIAGAYPKGQSPDLQRGSAREFEALKEACRSVRLPETDPVTGAQRPYT